MEVSMENNSISEQMKRRNELLQDLIDYISIELEALGMGEQKSKDTAEEIALKIHEKWRGLVIVFPMRPALVIEKLKKQVLNSFTGKNIRELVREYQVAERTIYEWILEEQRKKINSAQGKLSLE